MADNYYNVPTADVGRVTGATAGTTAGAIRGAVNPNANLPGMLQTDQALRDDRAGAGYETDNMLDNLIAQYNGQRKQNTNPNQYTNVAKARQMSGKSYGETERLSRLADSLNNRRWWKTGDIGSRTLKGGAQGIDIGHSERWEPITTQEMRQQRMNEDIDKQSRQEQVKLQADTNRHALELRKAADSITLAQQQLYANIDPAMEQALRTLNQQLNYGMPATASMQQYIATAAQYIQNHIDYDIGNDFMSVWQHSPILASVMQGKTGFLSVPAQSMARDDIKNYVYEEFVRKNGRNPNAIEANDLLNKANVLVSASLGAAQAGMYHQQGIDTKTTANKAGKQIANVEIAGGYTDLAANKQEAKNVRKYAKAMDKYQKQIDKINKGKA